MKTQLNPYDENRVAINSNYFSKANIELDNTVVNLVPTRGAVVKAAFVTHVGYRVLFNVKQADGKPVPFGAMATAELDSGTVSGIVGDNGELYLSGMPESGNVTLSWGHDASSHCIASYNLNNKTLKTELIQLSEICR